MMLWKMNLFSKLAFFGVSMLNLKGFSQICVPPAPISIMVHWDSQQVAKQAGIIVPGVRSNFQTKTSIQIAAKQSLQNIQIQPTRDWGVLAEPAPRGDVPKRRVTNPPAGLGFTWVDIWDASLGGSFTSQPLWTCSLDESWRNRAENRIYLIPPSIIPPSRSILGQDKVTNTVWWLSSLRLTSSQVEVVELCPFYPRSPFPGHRSGEASVVHRHHLS